MNGLVIKAAGVEWELDVLAAPYGGPHGGRDTHGEFFSTRTNFAEDRYGLPPVLFYHGYYANGTPQGEPEYIGRVVGRETRADGVWMRVVLDRTKALALRVWEAAKAGLTHASTGSIEHLVRVARDGEVLHWPIVELSLFDLATGAPANRHAVAIPAIKAVYNAAGLALPLDIEPMYQEDIRMELTAEELEQRIGDAITTRLEQERAAALAKAQEEESVQVRVDQAIKAARVQWEQETAADRRLPLGDGSFNGGHAPYAAKFADLWRYDNLDPGDQAVMIGVLSAARQAGHSRDGASERAIKALAIKLCDDTTGLGARGQHAMKAAGMPVKANEIQQSTLAGYGDEWIGVAYSTALWDKIRLGAEVAGMLPTIEIPQGMESISIPLSGASPTFYKVAAATDTAADGWPAATIPSGRLATDSKSLGVAKIGARVLWDGELEEDSIIPWVSELRKDMESEGAEVLDGVVVDGDTATGATTNINDIGNAGAQTATNVYLVFDGMRKLALVTNTANARAGSTLTDADFLLTAQLMGPAGINALDRTKVVMLIDPSLNYKALQLASVKTRDVNSNPTIENGNLTMIYGYKVAVSANMCRASATRLSNASGKIDLTTPANNTKMQILAVRPDQWRLGWKRKTQFETTRIPRADVTEIVLTMRVGLRYRDVEAAALSYNLS